MYSYNKINIIDITKSEPLGIIRDVLIIGSSKNNDHVAEYYHLLGEDEINSLVLKSKSANIAGEINEDLPEPLKEFYLPESVYYELTGSSREEYGHQYITKPLIEKIASGKKEFYEHFDYITHYEPLIFYLNRKQLIFFK